jgi:hypothetical protein
MPEAADPCAGTVANPTAPGIAPRPARWWNRGVSLTFQVAVFAALGFLLLHVGSGHTTQSRAFRGTPRFTVWAALIAVQVATWPVLFRAGRDLLRELKTAHGVRRRAGWEAVRLVALAVPVLGIWLAQQATGDREEASLWGLGVRMGIATAGGFVAAAPCILAIWRVHHGLGRAPVDRAAALLLFERLNPFRRAFTTGLTALGVLVTEVTLATGALRNALVQWQPTKAASFRRSSSFSTARSLR